MNFIGSRSRDLVARSFELAPFTKILYSSDALGPAELLYLGARLWRNAITKVVGEWIDDDYCSEADATRPCGFRCLSWTTNPCCTDSNVRGPPSSDPASQHITHPVSRSTGLAEADDEVDRHCDHEGAEEVGEQSVPQGDPAGGSG